MSDTTESPAGDDLIRRIEDGICWITLNRPDAGNAMTQFMRDQIADVGPRRLVRPVRPRGRHHRRRREGLLHRRRPAGRQRCRHGRSPTARRRTSSATGRA